MDTMKSRSDPGTFSKVAAPSKWRAQVISLEGAGRQVLGVATPHAGVGREPALQCGVQGVNGALLVEFLCVFALHGAQDHRTTNR